MRLAIRVVLGVFVLGTSGYFVIVRAGGQSATWSNRSVARPEVLTCSPAPCVLPPAQASEGGLEVADAPIAADPLNPKHLLLGANDYNCPNLELLSYLGFYLSNDGGSTWNGPVCMTGGIHIGRYVYFPDGLPMVGYDRNGTAYIAGAYFDNEGGFTGLVGLQKSSDGVNWSQPAVALRQENRFPNHNWLAVDTSPQSPHVNSLYISGVQVGSPGFPTEQLMVSRSSDGGATWTGVAVDPPQNGLNEDDYTTVATGKDGTVYVTWQHCVGNGPAAGCQNGTAYMLFSKSTDGGDTWSYPTVMTKITVAPTPCDCSIGVLPNTNNIPVSNYPVIGVDKSIGPHAGNLYVVMYTWTGTYMRVQVIRSTDGGATWSKPVPVASPTSNHDQFFPWLSVSGTGLVGVSWLDRRNDPANINYQAFAAISSDGGLSFRSNVQLTKAFSNPNNNGYPGNSWMGNYTGNTWAGSNFVAAWMDSSNGVNMQEMVGGIRVH